MRVIDQAEDLDYNVDLEELITDSCDDLYVRSSAFASLLVKALFQAWRYEVSPQPGRSQDREQIAHTEGMLVEAIRKELGTGPAALRVNFVETKPGRMHPLLRRKS